MDLVLVVDVSRNMSKPANLIREGAHLAVYELDSGDRVSVITYGSKAKVLSGLTSDKGRIENTLRQVKQPLIQWSRDRRLYDAILEAFRQLTPGSAPDHIRMVGLITNDIDRGSIHDMDDIVEGARSKGIAVWVFLIANPYANPAMFDNYMTFKYPDVRRAEERLRPLAAETGGVLSVLEMNGYILRKAFAACKAGVK